MQSETRRSFLSLSLGSVAAVCTGAVAYGVYRTFATPPAAARELDFSDLNQSSMTSITVGGRKAVVFNDPEDGMKAYILACTRAGCDLELSDSRTDKPPIWACKCDGSTFAMNGEALTGPAIHPLRRVGVQFKDGVMKVPPALGEVVRL